jgi:hypothetical protein
MTQYSFLFLAKDLCGAVSLNACDLGTKDEEQSLDVSRKLFTKGRALLKPFRQH